MSNVNNVIADMLQSMGEWMNDDAVWSAKELADLADIVRSGERNRLSSHIEELSAEISHLTEVIAALKLRAGEWVKCSDRLPTVREVNTMRDTVWACIPPYNQVVLVTRDYLKAVAVDGHYLWHSYPKDVQPLPPAVRLP